MTLKCVFISVGRDCPCFQLLVTLIIYRASVLMPLWVNVMTTNKENNNILCKEVTEDLSGYLKQTGLKLSVTAHYQSYGAVINPRCSFTCGE